MSSTSRALRTPTTWLLSPFCGGPPLSHVPGWMREENSRPPPAPKKTEKRIARRGCLVKHLESTRSGACTGSAPQVCGGSCVCVLHAVVGKWRKFSGRVAGPLSLGRGGSNAAQCGTLLLTFLWEHAPRVDPRYDEYYYCGPSYSEHIQWRHVLCTLPVSLFGCGFVLTFPSPSLVAALVCAVRAAVCPKPATQPAARKGPYCLLCTPNTLVHNLPDCTFFSVLLTCGCVLVSFRLERKGWAGVCDKTVVASSGFPLGLLTCSARRRCSSLSPP